MVRNFKKKKLPEGNFLCLYNVGSSLKIPTLTKPSKVTFLGSCQYQVELLKAIEILKPKFCLILLYNYVLRNLLS